MTGRNKTSPGRNGTEYRIIFPLRSVPSILFSAIMLGSRFGTPSKECSSPSSMCVRQKTVPGDIGNPTVPRGKAYIALHTFQEQLSFDHSMAASVAKHLNGPTSTGACRRFRIDVSSNDVTPQAVACVSTLLRMRINAC